MSLKVAAGRQPHLFAGTSGWAYPTWKPGFYPEASSAKKFLSFYAGQLNSVEGNYTFTKLPTAKQTADWLSQTAAAHHPLQPAFRLFPASRGVSRVNCSYR
jgi:hypothetical protein